MAAAEVVAATKGKASNELPEELRVGVEEYGEAPTEHVEKLAVQAVMNIKSQSELREWWEEADEADAWIDAVDDLLKRLG